MVPFRNPVIYILYLEASKGPGDCFLCVTQYFMFALRDKLMTLGDFTVTL